MRGSRPVLGERGGETPPRHSTRQGPEVMYGPPPGYKRKIGIAVWSTQMYPVFLEFKTPDLDEIRCALVLTKYTGLAALFTSTGFENAGFDRCAISFVRQQTWQILQSSDHSAAAADGLRLWESRGSPSNAHRLRVHWLS